MTLDPDIIVLDETLSPLDIAVRERVRKVLLALKQQGKALILIEHERDNLMTADQIWYLEDGRLQELDVLGGVHG